MSAEEKYNNIINTIESLIQNIDDEEFVSDEYIIDKAFKVGNAEYMATKERNAMFVFMTGSTPRNYVSERRMMAAYNNLINRTKWGLNEEYLISGVETQKGFIQKFKKIFAMTPKEAFEKKDATLLTYPKTWDVISDEYKKDACACLIEGKTRFGIDIDAFNKAQIAQNLQSHFGLNDLEAEFAFELADKNSLDFEKAFDYVYGYVWQYIDPPISDAKLREELRDRDIEKDLNSPEAINLYFNMNLGFEDILNLLEAQSEGRITGSLSNPNNPSIMEELEYRIYWDENWEEIVKSDSEKMNYDFSTPLLDVLTGKECESDYDDPNEDYFESLDEDDPERIEWEIGVAEERDPYINNQVLYEFIQMIEYDLDDYDNYLKLCSEIEGRPITYRGVESKKMPVGRFNFTDSNFNSFYVPNANKNSSENKFDELPF